MPNDNLLLEREFEIPKDQASYKVKVIAVFEMHGFNLTGTGGESGMFHFNFSFRGQHAQSWQPDKNLYSRDEAKAAAQHLIDSGFIRTHIENQIQTWIYLGL
jgi:hypothetical protein